MAVKFIFWPDGAGVAKEILVLFGSTPTIVFWPDGAGVAKEVLFEGFAVGAGGNIVEETLEEDTVDLDDFTDAEFVDATNETLQELLEAEDLSFDSMPVESLFLFEDATISELITEAFGDGALIDEALISELFESQQDMEELLVEQAMLVFIDLRYEALVEAWVVNLKTNGISRYSWPAFNSFAFVNGKYYAAKDDGIFEITGDEDDGEVIDAHITTGKLEMGSGQKKRTFAVYLDVETDGQLNLKVYADGQSYTYPVKIPPRNISGEMHETVRADIGRGLRARNWVFELQNVDGSDFDWSKLQILPIVLDRRVR